MFCISYSVFHPVHLKFFYILAAAALGQGGYPQGVAGKSTGKAVTYLFGLCRHHFSRLH